MDKNTEQNIVNTLISTAQVEDLNNEVEGELPFAYFSPESDGKVIWMANKDTNNNIVSVFSYDGVDGKEKMVKYISLEEANDIRRELIRNRWKKMKNPKFEFSYKDEETGKSRQLTKREKRYIRKKIAKGKDPSVNPNPHASRGKLSHGDTSKRSV